MNKSKSQDELTLTPRGQHFLGQFRAMASLCEILIETDDAELAYSLVQLAQAETKRIETKFSRYRSDNIIHAINNANGQSIELDDETSALIDYSQLCYQLSDGLFDITSGVLRRAWIFDGSDKIPEQATIDAILPLVGWSKVNWQKPFLTLLAGMEIDLGGIGKEYAVDKVLHLLMLQTKLPILINFGGDLAVSGAQKNQQAWQVGIEAPEQKVETPDQKTEASKILEIAAGALATSGDTKRFLLRNGKRYGHILNPKTGYPIENAPRSVTVAGSTCVQAGTLSTLALLQGENAEIFLQNQQAIHWCLR
jgi:thiamine biosynthesis lipoprotein